jgi:hypothetical protein
MLLTSAIGRRPRGVARTGRTVAAGALLLASAADAQVGDYSWVTYPGWIPSDRVVPRVTVTHPYDSVSRRYTYQYTMGNDASAQQAILELGLLFSLPVSQVRAAAGWEGFAFSQTGNYAMPGVDFFATPGDEYGESPNGPAPAQIEPGQSLSGFSYASEYPPGLVRAYARGFAPIPFLPDDFDDATLLVPDDTTDAQRIWLLGPYRYTQVISEGTTTTCEGIPPPLPPQCETSGANGFLGWMNLFWGDTVTSPLPIALKFSLHGETVFTETLSVKLNGVDVTSYFFPDPTGGASVVGVLSLGSSPLREGENRIVTRIEGILPGTSTRTHDWDEFPFTVVRR